MKKFAVILAGSGRLDGNNIHEVVLLLSELAKHGASYQCFAPDMLQHEVVNHYTGKVQPEQRNVLYEASRINVDPALPLTQLKEEDFDGLCFPGGYGVAKNLCTFAFSGEKYVVNVEIENLIKSFHAHKKPIVALCIAPMLLAKVLPQVKLTLGAACEAGEVAKKLGAEVEETSAGEVCIDRENNIYTTPCYMLNSSIAEVALGIENLVKKLLAAF
ncbi:MAG: isoprenoid biosynthesis glyoxalase ElbB [Bacteroides sp.]